MGDARTELWSSLRKVPPLLASFLCSMFLRHTRGRGVPLRVAPQLSGGPVRTRRKSPRRPRSCGTAPPPPCGVPYATRVVSAAARPTPTVARAGSRRGARPSWRRRVAHPTVTGDRGQGQLVAHPWSAGAVGGCRGGDQPDEIVPPGRQDARAPPHGSATAVGRGPVRQPVGGAQRGRSGLRRRRHPPPSVFCARRGP